MIPGWPPAAGARPSDTTGWRRPVSGRSRSTNGWGRTGIGAADAIKRPLKALRAWRPINAPVTLATRSASRLTGREFESAIKHLPRSGPVRSKLPNGEVLRMWSRGDDWVSNQVFWKGWEGYEPETTPVFFHLARHAEVVLDIGAYVGFFAILAGLANREGRVLAFEPMPDNAERLRGHLELNKLENVEPIQAAVSDVEG